jgi:hypothetical protein
LEVVAMRIERTLVALAVSAIVSFIAGCSATAPSAQPVVARPPAVTEIRPTATQTLIYACEFTANTCVWYVRGVNRLAGSITGLSLPSGVGVDAAGNVYIANLGAQDVPVYAKGSTTLVRTLDDSGHLPIDVKVDSDGTVYVANIQDVNSATGSVSVYAPGSTTISRVIKDPTLVNPTGIAVDEHHELIVCFDDSNGGDCDEFVHARGPGHIVVSDFPATMEGVAFDKAGNIAVQNANYGTFYFQANFSPCNADQTNGSEMYLAFDRGGNHIYKTNAGGFIEENAYLPCFGSTLVKKYDAGLNGNVPYGVATDPAPGL